VVGVAAEGVGGAGMDGEDRLDPVGPVGPPGRTAERDQSGPGWGRQGRSILQRAGSGRPGMTRGAT